MAQNYFKRNYKDALKNIIPTLYFNTTVEASSGAISQVDNILNSHINFCVNQPSLLGVSAVGAFSSINTIQGFCRWFLPQNYKKNNLNPLNFETQILHPIGLCTGKIEGEACTYFNPSSLPNQTTFSGLPASKVLSFFKEDFLPRVVLNSSSLADTTASAFSNTASGTHEFLINTLGWAYFLNTSAVNVAPSGFVASALTDMYLSGTNFTIKEGIEGLSQYVWENWSDLSSISTDLLPPVYYSGTGEYTSGTQGLDRLKTLVEVIYSDQIFSKDDSYIEDAFTDYADNGYWLDSRELTGPFSKFIEGISFSMFDYLNEAQKLEYLYDLDLCPDNLLKYVAELIGWELRGSNPSGWRRQLRFAMRLYKQKGTKEGLYNAMTTVLPGTSLEPSAISEFHESYVPYLMYYLLNTDTSIFQSFTSWSMEKADLYTNGEYSYSDMDYNIRVAIDHILLRAVHKYNDLFYVRNFKFNLNDPQFIFEYRNRAFPIPPWEEIKFYRGCDLTQELITFIKDELICLGVSQTHAQNFYDYILSNTINSSSGPEYYSNAFLFFTSGLNIAPNENTILDAKEVHKYDFLSLWNSKSSTFNVSVSSASFDSPFFNSSIFNKKDFFQSLSIVDEFTPAKAIPRTHVDLEDSETTRETYYTCPSVRFWLHDITTSGFQGGSHSSGVSFSGIAGAFGSDYASVPNSSRAINDHNNLPVFKRGLVDSPTDFAQLDGSAVSAVPLTSVFRTNMRRRNFSKTLEKGGWYTRTGYNMPSYYNLSSGGSYTEFYPLGFVFDQYQYNPVFNFKNMYEVSSWPYEDSVWSECYNLDSTLSFSSIPVSSTFDIRGSTALSTDSCDDYVRRDRSPEMVKFLFKLLDKKYTKEAERIYEVNKVLIDTSSYINHINVIKSRLWASSPDIKDIYYNQRLGKRIFGRGSPDSMHKMFKDYISYFTGTGIGNGLLTTYKEGGPNILSHTYGPLLLNGNFTTDGSSLALSSSLVTTETYNSSSFTVKELSAISNNITASSTSSMFVELTEVRNPYMMSGVELVDSFNGDSEYSIFRLNDTNASPDRDNYNINNTLITLNNKGYFPRLRFNLKEYGVDENFIIPERDFRLTLTASIGRYNSNLVGGGSFGAWIHTDVETDSKGNEVFWNLMPNGKWEIQNASILQQTGAINYVKQSLSHTLNYSDTHNAAGATACFAESSNDEVVGFLQEDDFRAMSLDFNTNNNIIKVPLSYYNYQNQVNRTTQNYIVEIFLYDNIDPSMFSIVEGVSISDLRQYSRTDIKYPITYNDYALYNSYMDNIINFYDSSGALLPSGSDIYLTSGGDMSTSSGDGVTAHIAKIFGTNTKGYLYSKLLATNSNGWFGDSNNNVFFMPSSVYTGRLSVSSLADSLSLSSIIIEGKTLGSKIHKKETLFVPLDAEQVLIILREFKRLQAEMGARNKVISEPEFGPEGGSRLNYRVAPMWGLPGGYTAFKAAGRQYTKVILEN